MKKPKKYYVENENRITAVYVETYVEPDYRSKRAAEYPDFREYLDAVVKSVRKTKPWPRQEKRNCRPIAACVWK